MKTRRVALYAAGIFLLSLGLALNVKSYLGVAPILTPPRSISDYNSWNFSNILFVFYSVFIILQIPLRGKQWKAWELLQFPIGLVITRLVGIFTNIIPVTQDASLGIKIMILAIAILVTGVGVALSVDMRLIPNPADGLAHAIGKRFGIGLGMGKNILDLSSVGIAFIYSLVLTHTIGAIGIGTLAAGLLVGRVIALFNKLWKVKLETAAGLNE